MYTRFSKSLMALFLLCSTSLSVQAVDLLYQSTGTEIYSYDVSSNNTTTILASKSLVASGLNQGGAMAFDKNGNMFVVETGAYKITKIAKGGAISTFVSGLSFQPSNLTFDTAGNLYTSDTSYGYSGTIYKITSTGSLSTFASTGVGIRGLAFDSNGYLFASAYPANSILRITADGSNVSTFVNSPSANAGAIAFDSQGNLIVNTSYWGTSSILRVTPGASVSTVLNFGSGGTGLNGIAIDKQNYMYVAGPYSGQITKINPGYGVEFSMAVGGGGSLVFGPEVVPEPSTYALGAVATGAMVFVMRRRKQGQK